MHLRELYRASCVISIVVIYFSLLSGFPALAGEQPLVFPIPQEMEEHKDHFTLDGRVLVLLPEKPSDNDLFVARFLASELAERHGMVLQAQNAPKLPADRRFILMGSLANPLVKGALSPEDRASVLKLIPEGYLLKVTGDRVIIAGRDDQGTFYGLQTLRQLIERADGALRVRGVRIADWPHKPFRGIRLYVPGPDNIAFFKRFLRDFAALYKFNKVIIEMNACMRLDRHPELNAGAIELFKHLNYTRRDRSAGPHGESQDSPNQDAGDGVILEKEDVADLVRYANRHFIEVIPEMPSLTHSYYLLNRHRELAEIQEAEWPDTYCPSNPDVYRLLFDVQDEYLEVMKPRMVNIAHDEWRMPTGVCPRCKGKDCGELFAEDVSKIVGHLREHGVKVAMWGDHLLENVRGKGLQSKKTRSGYEYQLPGALTPEQVREKIPKDILILNWFWDDRKEAADAEGGEANDLAVADFGFQQAYGNLGPGIQNYARRSAHPSVIGGSPSSWAATNEFNMGKDLMLDFLGCANLLWSKHWPEQEILLEMVQARMPEVRRNLSGKSAPSEDGDAVTPLDIAPLFSDEAILGSDLKGLKTGSVAAGKKVFNLPDPAAGGGKCALAVVTEGKEGTTKLPPVQAIPIGRDVSSLIFLHGCARPAANERSYRYVYNFDDTADLLAWYDVVYEDGFIETIPVRYGVNILEWQGWPNVEKPFCCYAGDPVLCTKPEGSPAKSFFAFEWSNPRLGRVVKEVRLKGTSQFKTLYYKTISENAVVLLALSVVEKRTDLQAVTALPRFGETNKAKDAK